MENSSLNVIVEDKIPFIEGCLEPFANVRYLPPEAITPDAVRDADAIFVRTRTRCDAALLAGSRCRFVATATIGMDHIDTAWCHAAGIEAVNAPGCNAPAVAQYVLASILRIVSRPISQYTIGIVGVGHVGSIVERWARALDMEVLLNDPPRQAAEGGDQWSSLDEIARRADIITFHTPLDETTRHLADDTFFDSLRRGPIIVNAARGPVVDNAALIRALAAGKVHHAIIDTWEGEPNISPELLQKATVATPHIAGYSLEGKIRATRLVLDAFSRHFSLPHIPLSTAAPAFHASQSAGLTAADLAALAAPAPATVTAPALLRSYDPLADTAAMRRALTSALAASPAGDTTLSAAVASVDAASVDDSAAAASSTPADIFERLRDTYPLRREVPSARPD